MLKTDKNKKSHQTFLKGPCSTLAALTLSVNGCYFFIYLFCNYVGYPVPARGCNKTLIDSANCCNFDFKRTCGSSLASQAVKFNSSSSWFAAVIPSLMFLNRPEVQLQMAVLYTKGKVACHANT